MFGLQCLLVRVYNMDVTYITDSSGNCIRDYLSVCIVLTTHQPVFGCGSLYARIWQAGITPCRYGQKRPPDIRLITEL